MHLLRKLAVVVGTLALAAGIAQAQTPKKGGTLNFAVVAEPPTLDCHGRTTFAFAHPVRPHYSLLLKFAGKYDAMKIVGDLAESWEMAPDGLSYTFKLRNGVKFHDGSPMTSEDVKASYDRIINPPEGVVSLRRSAHADIGGIETPDPNTVVFKLKKPNASMHIHFASPFNCIYSAAKLKENPRYPEKTIMGSGAFKFVEHVKGSIWEGKRFDGYFRKDRPYLDGYKAFFVKSDSVVPGILGGQFDAEFRGRKPKERDQIVDGLKDNANVIEGPWVNNLMLVFNTTRKPFDDIRVRQALSLAIDRWGGSEALSKISILKFVGGVMRPGYAMSLPEAELVKLPGFAKDINKSREEAKKLLEEAGVSNLKFKLLNRNIAEPYTPAASTRSTSGGASAWRRSTSSSRPSCTSIAMKGGNFDVAVEFQADFMDDPTAQFSKYLTKKLSPSGYSGHTDTKIDDLYKKQRRTVDPAERTKIVHEMERYALTQAYNVPLLWWQRIIVNHKKIKGWE